VTRTRWSKLLVGAALGLGAAAVAWMLGLLPFFKTIELKSYDVRVRWTANPAAARRDIALIAIDDSSVRRLDSEVGRWPWPRLVHAALIDFLARAPARVIVYDVLFTEHDKRTFTVGPDTWTGEESDRALAASAAKAGNVVFAADVTSDELAQLDRTSIDRLRAGQPFAADADFEARPSLILPYAELTDAAAAVGHNFMVYDPDGPVRRTAPFVRVGTLGVPSLGVAASLLYERLGPAAVSRSGPTLHVGGTAAPLVDADIPSLDGPSIAARRMLVRFTGPVVDQGKTTYPDFSFYDLFYSEQQLLAGAKPAIDPALFRDKVVVVGTTAAGLSDLFTVPFGGGKMPGMQVHANVIDNLLSRRFMRQVHPGVDAALLVLCALLVAFCGVVMNVWRTIAVAVVVLVLLGAASVAMGAEGLWLALTRPVLGVLFATFGATAYQYLVEGREKRQVKQVFSRFVSRDVFDQLMADPARARLGGERREMTVLFSDIRGFTTFSEKGRPEEIVRQLNEYFTQMVAVLFRHGGTIDKFVGDMVMALFGAPLADPDHAEHAVSAALGMIAELAVLNARWAAEGRPVLDIGVGVNTGEMVAGNIGSDTIMSYTVIGDAVNLGSRLESLNKQYATHIIISDETRKRLKGRYDMKSLGSVVVKGKTEPVAIFEVRPPGPGPSPDADPGQSRTEQP
jgi:adenylate cyclase